VGGSKNSTHFSGVKRLNDLLIVATIVFLVSVVLGIMPRPWKWAQIVRVLYLLLAFACLIVIVLILTGVYRQSMGTRLVLLPLLRCIAKYTDC